jgi:radical SAM-linked protein
MMRVRVDYKKENFFIFLSSLDMIRYFERALRRSGLPILFTSGFSPKPKIDFSLALPLGIQSESEIFDFYLVEKVQEEKIFEKLINSIDKNLIINRIREVKLNSPSIASLITHFKLEISFNKKINFMLKDFVLKKKDVGENLIELKDFIYKEEDEENKKIVIIRKDVSLRELYDNLKEFFQENFSIKKIKNLRISNEILLDIFDLD